MNETRNGWPPGGAFEHPLLLGRGDDGFAELGVEFLAEGLSRGERIAVAVPAHRLEPLAAEFGPRLRMFNLSEGVRNPGRIIPLVLFAFADEHPATPVRILQEAVWPGRSELEYPACVQHEALTNLAFAGRAMTIGCFYDTGALSPGVLADACATHPKVLDGRSPNGAARGGTVLDGAASEDRSPSYAPVSAFDRYDLPLPEPDGPSSELRFNGATQELTRDLAARSALAADFPEDRTVDVELVVNELTANSIAHGGGQGDLRIWAEKENLVCEVTDHGSLADPLAGRRPAGLSVTGGRGLLLVHCLADLVRVHTVNGALTIRAYFARQTVPDRV